MSDGSKLMGKGAKSGNIGAELGRSGGLDPDPRAGASGSTPFPSHETDPPAEDATGSRPSEEQDDDDADAGGARHSESLASPGRHQLRRPAPSTRDDLPRNGKIPYICHDYPPVPATETATNDSISFQKCVDR